MKNIKKITVLDLFHDIFKDKKNIFKIKKCSNIACDSDIILSIKLQNLPKTSPWQHLTFRTGKLNWSKISWQSFLEYLVITASIYLHFFIMNLDSDTSKCSFIWVFRPWFIKVVIFSNHPLCKKNHMWCEYNLCCLHTNRLVFIELNFSNIRVAELINALNLVERLLNLLIKLKKM